MPSGRSRLRWATRAERDLRTIWSYYATEASIEVADKVIGSVRAAVLRIAEHPQSGRPRNELRPGLRSALVHPYLIFYRVDNEEVQIARVLHERRNLAVALKSQD